MADESKVWCVKIRERLGRAAASQMLLSYYPKYYIASFGQ